MRRCITYIQKDTHIRNTSKRMVFFRQAANPLKSGKSRKEKIPTSSFEKNKKEEKKRWQNYKKMKVETHTLRIWACLLFIALSLVSN